MTSRLLSTVVLLCGVFAISAQQNVGINTLTPQANLHVNGTFRLQDGVIIHGISPDSTMTPGSDSLVPTQLAVKRYMERGAFAPVAEPDSIFQHTSTFPEPNRHVLMIDVKDSDIYYTSIISGGGVILHRVDAGNPDSLYTKSSLLINESVLDLTVSDNQAFITRGNLIALCRYNISDPDTIIALGCTNISGQNRARQISAVGNILYSRVHNGSLCAADVSDPDMLLNLGCIAINTTSPPVIEENRLEVRGNFAYLTTGLNRLIVCDISNPAAMVIRDSIDIPAQGFSLAVDGNFAYVLSRSPNLLSVFDISNPDMIVARGSIALFVSNPYQVKVAHQRALVLSTSSDRIHVYDVSDPDQPIYDHHVGGFVNNINPMGGPEWKMDVSFPYVYTPNSSGMGILDWTEALDHRMLTMYPDGTMQFDMQGWQMDHARNVFAEQAQVGIGTSSPSERLHVVGNMKLDGSLLVPGSRVVELGAGVTGKHVDAGKIGYQVWSEGLDIVGAGTPGNRKMHLYAEGGITVDGFMQVKGANILEFGLGIPKQQDAGKIAYQTFSGNALDITGAGTSVATRRIKFFADGGSIFTGNIDATGRSHLRYGNGSSAGMFYYTSTNTSAAFIGIHSDTMVGIQGIPGDTWGLLMHTQSGSVGIGTTSPTYLLDVNGRARIRHNGQTAGIFYNTSANIAEGFIGMRNDTQLGLWGNTSGAWHMVMNTTDGRVGIGTVDPQTKLHVQGTTAISGLLGIGLTNPTAALHVAGFQKIESAFTLEFGAGVPGKYVDAGKIGYQTFTPGALDIVGAGTSTADRKVMIWADGGTELTGGLTIADTLNAPVIFNMPWVDLTGSLQNNWVNYGSGYATVAVYKDPQGVVHLRGLIKDGTNTQNTMILNLPTGYRPTYGHLTFSVVNGDNNTGRVDVRSNGDVIFYGTTNMFLSLNEITFRAY